jgi:hypothetical protein
MRLRLRSKAERPGRGAARLEGLEASLTGQTDRQTEGTWTRHGSDTEHATQESLYETLPKRARF